MKQPIGLSSAVTLEEAINIFDTLADMEDIAFGYSYDGCYARAHIMCKRLIELGFDAGKAWAFETDDESLELRTLEGERFSWFFHVAATLPIITDDNQVQQLVFDPSLFDGPVTIEEWGNTINASSKQLQFTKFGEPPEGYSGDYDPYDCTNEETDSKAQKVMDNYMRSNKDPRFVFSSTQRKKIYGSVPITSSFQGKTWISEVLRKQNKSLAKKIEKDSDSGISGQFGKVNAQKSTAENTTPHKQFFVSIVERLAQKIRGHHGI